MIKKIIISIFFGLFLCGLLACTKKESPNTIRVGTISGPETQLMRVASKVALKQYGLHVKVIVFSDYTLPNVALSDGSIDANVFQHMPYLQSQIKMHGYRIMSIGKTFLYPMGLYSKKIKNLSELKPGSKVAIPNDPSNEGRALLLLQSAKLLTLRKGAGVDATPMDVIKNPKRLQFVVLDAAELPRALGDVMLAAINSNYAVPSGLSPSKDALLIENAKSPYVNIIVARRSDYQKKKLKELAAAYQSQPVIDAAKKLFGDAAIPGFTIQKTALQNVIPTRVPKSSKE